MTDDLLRMRGIRKSFGGVEVLHGVDFSVGRGEIRALVGHNGAGKSTLMRVLGGGYPDHDGDVEVAGESVRLTTPKDALEHGVAIIYQDFSLVPDMTVAENIGLGREPLAGGGTLLAHRALRCRSAEEARRFGIVLPLDDRVRTLGVAAQQQTEIVRALARDARVLVMDEPTARLAPAERAQLFTVMRQLAESGVGIVFISHFLDEVVDVADRITVMRDGRVVSETTSADIAPDALARMLIGKEESAVVADRVATAPDRVDDTPALSVAELAVGTRPPVSFTVRAGEIVGIAGLVGSGRSRLLRALVGDVRAPGDVRVGRVPLRRRSPTTSARAGLLMVPEDRKRTGLVLTGSVRQNIEMTALMTSLTRFGIVRRRARAQVVKDAVTQFAIRPPRPDAGVAHLSGGNAQKVLLARAVAAEPVALLIDQPTAGVDVGAKTELHQRVVELADRGTGVVVVSDDLDELITLSDRLLVLVAGRIVGELPKGAVRAELLAAISTNDAGNDTTETIDHAGSDV